ncbi:MAG: hypothetical protein ACERKO_03520, partial [Acetanaerobacterium sp.]
PVAEILAHADALAPVMDRLIAYPPRAMFGLEDTLTAQLERLRALGVDKLLAPGIGAAELGARLGMHLFGGFSLNLTNSLALDEAQRAGLCDTELSIELDLVRAKALSGTLARGIIAYGRLPLMLVRCCPLKHTTTCAACAQRGGYMSDRLNNRFWVACEGAGSEVFNCHTLYLADRLPELREFDFITLLFTDETARTAQSVIRAYQMGGTPPKEFTRGLYYRGIL